MEGQTGLTEIIDGLVADFQERELPRVTPRSLERRHPRRTGGGGVGHILIYRGRHLCGGALSFPLSKEAFDLLTSPTPYRSTAQEGRRHRPLPTRNKNRLPGEGTQVPGGGGEAERMSPPVKGEAMESRGEDRETEGEAMEFKSMDQPLSSMATELKGESVESKSMDQPLSSMATELKGESVEFKSMDQPLSNMATELKGESVESKSMDRPGESKTTEGKSMD